MKFCGLFVTTGIVCSTQELLLLLTLVQWLRDVLNLEKCPTLSLEKYPALSRLDAFGNLQLAMKKYLILCQSGLKTPVTCHYESCELARFIWPQKMWLQNHRIISVGKYLQDHGVQPLTDHHHVTQTMALSVTSSNFFNMSRDVDSTTSLPGKSVPMSNNPFCEEILCDIQPEPHLVQLEARFSLPVTGCWGEEGTPHLGTASFQVFVAIRSPLSLLQAKHSQLLQEDSFIGLFL